MVSSDRRGDHPDQPDGVPAGALRLAGQRVGRPFEGERHRDGRELGDEAAAPSPERPASSGRRGRTARCRATDAPAWCSNAPRSADTGLKLAEDCGAFIESGIGPRLPSTYRGFERRKHPPRLARQPRSVGDAQDQRPGLHVGLETHSRAGTANDRKQRMRGWPWRLNAAGIRVARAAPAAQHDDRRRIGCGSRRRRSGRQRCELDLSFGFSIAGACGATVRCRPPRMTVICGLSGATGAADGFALGGGRAASFAGGAAGSGDACGLSLGLGAAGKRRGAVLAGFSAVGGAAAVTGAGSATDGAAGAGSGVGGAATGFSIVGGAGRGVTAAMLGPAA